jgi:hypothetical protein
MPLFKGPIKRPAVRKPKKPTLNKFANSKKPNNSTQISKDLRESFGDLAKSLMQNKSKPKTKSTITSEQQKKKAILLTRQKQRIKQIKKAKKENKKRSA